ncbi:MULTISPECIES: ABC transporter ATP-binding protein [Halomonadaceae]|uniref:ABC transporter ATP-binding protein n=1 Tax=Halomonadaceae TaxID=28256 RepID=UPI001C27172D|nr:MULTISPECIES: ABC transporter ATP-binding protein [Halomonas]
MKSAAWEDIDEKGIDQVRVTNLMVGFVQENRVIRAVNDISFEIKKGEVLCLLGESGSGKSVTLRALLGLLPKQANVTGNVVISGHDVLALRGQHLRDYRGAVTSMIFQEPMNALDAVFPVGFQIAETVRRHMKVSRRAAKQRALELMRLVQIPSPERRYYAYPHELSGGLRQRVMIAVALAPEPSFLLADEPTTALDATVQIQILLLLRKLVDELGMSMVFVTHDLGVAGEISDRIAVMYAGRFVEIGQTHEVVKEPMHPYTVGLLNATITPAHRGHLLTPIPGEPPDLAALPRGCSFSQRCAHVSDKCSEKVPDFERREEGRYIRCIKEMSLE